MSQVAMVWPLIASNDNDDFENPSARVAMPKLECACSRARIQFFQTNKIASQSWHEKPPFPLSCQSTTLDASASDEENDELV